MNISEKIAAIRKQPEHIRLRYVWACVGFSMLLIMIIWFFSIASLFQNDYEQTGTDSVETLKNQLQDINQQAPSLEDFAQTPLTIGNEGIITDKNSDEFEYPQNTESEIPQSPAYSNEE
ncbi:MAG: hypothetical protein ACD_56C00171G0002 [uncultured bacterium]|nr:MAG: hypothetical protein ACD_56C00171G0002 [uncultured bacterium]